MTFGEFLEIMGKRYGILTHINAIQEISDTDIEASRSIQELTIPKVVKKQFRMETVYQMRSGHV